MKNHAWRWWYGLVSLWAACLCAPLTHAETSAQNRAAAEVLFNEAGQLFRQGKYEEACDKLSNSQKLDPAVGTLLNLARCYEKIGKTASAWIAFVDAATAAKAAGQSEREEAARQGANRLAPVVPKLSIQVPEPSAVSGLEILRNGEAVPEAMWNTASPTDPGEHVIEAKAPGKKPWSARVHLDASKEETVTVPALEDGPKPDQPGEAKRSGFGTQRVIALVTAGVGVAGLGVGSAFGLMAKSDRDRADETCSGNTCSDKAGLDANDRAIQRATLSTIFVSAGAACLVGGAVLWFTAPKSSKPSDTAEPKGVARVAPLLARDVQGLVVEGRF
ncbi:MAG: hypothetical protein ACOY0T_36120 [Myxococcota bacterium]